MGGLAAGAGVALGAVAVLGKAAFDSASNLQQQAGAVDAVFGANAEKMHAYAKDAAETVGLAQSEYSQLASVLGSQLSNAGFAGDALTGTVDGLVKQGADLAAQFGGSTADAVSALSSVLKGETDPIERYGISIKQSDISARLAAQGQDKLTGSALKNAQAAAALALVSEQSASSVGAFGRESETAAGKQATLGAKWENLKATLGEKLLPAFTLAATFVEDKVLPAFEKLTEKGGPLATILGNVGTFIKDELLPTLQGLWDELSPKLIPIFQTVAGIIKDHVVPAFNTVWAFVKDYVIPIFKNTLGPALDGLKSAWGSISDALDRNKEKFQGIYDKMKPFFEFMRDKVAPLVGGALKKGFETLGDVIGGVIDSVAWILDKGADISNFLFGASSAAEGGSARGAAPLAARSTVFGAARGAGPLRAASSPLRGASAGPGGAAQGLIAAGDTITVNVQGFVGSEDALADAIEAMLDRRRRRTGIAPAFGGVRVA
jgi:hypothetical protein